MFEESKKIFCVFLWFCVSSILALFFSTFDALILISENTLMWLNIAIFLMSIAPAILYNNKKISSALKLIISLAWGGVVVYGLKYFLLFVLQVPIIKLPDNFPLGIGFLIVFLLIIILMLMFWGSFGYFMKIFNEDEKIYKDNEEYLSWLRSQQVAQTPDQVVKKYVKRITNIAILLLIISFISIAKEPQTKYLFTLFFILFSLGGIGMYLLLYQSSAILNLKTQDYKIPKDMTKKWNNLLKLFFIPLIVIPLAIPWRFQIIQIPTLTTYLKELFKQPVTIDEEKIQRSVYTPDFSVNLVEVEKDTGITEDIEELIGNIYRIRLIMSEEWLIKTGEKLNLSNRTSILYEIQFNYVDKLEDKEHIVSKRGPGALRASDFAEDERVELSGNDYVILELGENDEASFKIIVGLAKINIDDTTTVITGTEEPAWEEKDQVVPLTALKYIAIIVVSAFGLNLIFAIIGGILFLKLRYVKRSGLAQFFINRYRLFKGFINGIFSFIALIAKIIAGVFRMGERKNKEDEVSSLVRKQLYSLFANKKKMSDRKKDEVMTIIKEFIRMIEITGKFVAPYRHHYGPEEYINIVSKNLPELKGILKKIVDTFNESRYSEHILTDVKIGNYQKAISFIIEQVINSGAMDLKDRGGESPAL